MGRPVPEDDKIEEVVVEKEEITNEKEPEKNDPVEEVEEELEHEHKEGEEEEVLSESALEALLTDERAGWVPEKRVKEIAEDRNAARRDADQARDVAQKLLERLEEFSRPAAVTEKKRDFDADLKDLKAKYKAGEIEMDDYLDARDTLATERAELAAEARLKPVVEKLETEAQRARAERAANELEAAAKPLYAKFPFLDISSKDKNMDAIAQVIAVRNELIRSGVSPVRAMKLAAMEVGPEFEGAESTEETVEVADDNVADIRNARVQAARKAAADAANKTPAPLGKTGTGTKEQPGKITLTRSVEDAEKWDKMTAEQRKQVVFR